jgi:pimeloyl-ACP methyl ester carboxylesterase
MTATVELSPSIWRTAEAEGVAAALYARTRRALPFPTDERTIDTRLGPTHLLTAGPADAPPLLMLQGGNVVNPITLAWLTPLVDRLRIVAPDTPGQPGLSHPHRPQDPEAYGGWVADVLDGVSWPSAAVMGVSQGGAIAVRAAAHHPERVDRLVLVAPDGITTPPTRAKLALTLGFLDHRLRHRRSTVEGVARRLSGGRTPSRDLVDAIELSFGGTTLESKDLPLATAQELRGFAAPVLVIAGARDPLFPPDRVLPRAREVFGARVSTATLDDAGHILDAPAIGALAEALAQFMVLREVGA